MNSGERLWFIGLLTLLGAGWGITQPLAKIAVSTGHGYLGLIFWQLVIGALAMAVISALRGRRLPIHPRALATYAVIAMIGTVIPNSASFQALVHLPSGVHSVLMSLVPMAAFPIALAMHLEKFSLRRVFGLLLGLGGVLLLVLPQTSLPDPAMMVWVPLSLVAVICYASEGNYVARWGTGGLDAIEVLFGASLVGAMIALPLALATGQYISPLRLWSAPEWALVASSVVHVLVYAGYVWLVGRAGAVFAAQVGYLVTGFGVLFAMLLLNESYSPYFWAAMALILTGVFLVQPRRQEALAPGAAIKETAR